LFGSSADQHVVGEQQVFATRVEDPFSAAPERNHPHSHLHRQLDLFELAIGERGALPHANPVRYLFGGGEIGPHTLLRFYILHCIFIPLVASLFMAVHFWRIRRDGFSGPAL